MKFPFIITAVIMIVVIRHIVTMLHELAHAIPALWLTKDKVTVYLGSYGDDTTGKRFAIGKLEIRFDHKMMWQGGLCQLAAAEVPAKHTIVYTALGPIVPFAVGLTLFSVALSNDFGNDAMLFAFLFFVIGFIGLVQNLVPSVRPITLKNGNVIYNDGQIIKTCLTDLKYGHDYTAGVRHYNNANYQDALDAFNRLPKKFAKKPYIIRLKASCHIKLRHFEKSIKKYNLLQEKQCTQPDDYCNIGYALGELGRHEESVPYYLKAIRINPGHKYSLNNLGYVMILQGRYEEGIQWSNKAITCDANFAFPYNNRGLAKMKLGDYESGLEDTKKSMELDPANAYGYRNLGIYHISCNDKVAALENLNKAKEIDPNTYQIDELLAEAESLKG